MKDPEQIERLTITLELKTNKRELKKTVDLKKHVLDMLQDQTQGEANGQISRTPFPDGSP